MFSEKLSAIDSLLGIVHQRKPTPSTNQTFPIPCLSSFSDSRSKPIRKPTQIHSMTQEKDKQNISNQNNTKDIIVLLDS